MASIYVEVELDLDNVDTKDLKQELESRGYLVDEDTSSDLSIENPVDLGRFLEQRTNENIEQYMKRFIQSLDRHFSDIVINSINEYNLYK